MGHDSLEAFAVTRDMSQFFTRVEFTGGGARALLDRAAGDTSIPVEDASVFPASGEVVHRFNRLTYTNRNLGGGGGSLVGPGAAPSSAPAVALAAGSGVDTGDHDYAYVFVTAAGKTLPSPITTIAAGVVAAPTTAAVAGTPSSGGSMTPGTHRYYPVFRTAAGATTAGPASNAVATDILSPPGGFNAEDYPPTGSGGLTPNSTYKWRLTWITSTAESAPGTVVQEIMQFDGSTSRMPLSNLPISGDSRVTGRKLYRTEANGSTFKLEATLNNTDTTYMSTMADGALGATAPTGDTGTQRGTCAVTGIPVYPSALVTHVDLYREFNSAGAGTAKLAFSVANGTTSANDTVANSGLGATVPGSNTAVANQVDVTFPAGPTGTTDIELYRTEADAAQLQLLHAVGSNTGGTYTDSTADASLGANAPAADDSGLTQPEGQVLAGETSIGLANTAAFDAGGGWAMIGQQTIQYGGTTSNTLTGVPASGIGAVGAPIGYNATITPAPFLSGIPASGDGSIAHSIIKGDDLNLLVTVNDTDAQTLLASLIGGTGIRVLPDGDRRLSYEESVLRATAMLALRNHIEVTVRCRTRDKNMRAGRVVTVTLPGHQVNDDFKIQEVRIHNFTEALFPWFDVTASNSLFTFEELLASLRQKSGA